MSQPAVDIDELTQRFLAAIMLNPLRGTQLTCETCTGPVGSEYSRCWRCNDDAHRAFKVAGRVIPLTYACAGRQADNDLYRYKDPMTAEKRLQNPSFQRLLVLLLGFALRHAGCFDDVADKPVTRVAPVPSLSGRTEPHPLTALASVLPKRWSPIGLTASSVPPHRRRATDPSHFQVADPADVAGRHVVVLDDTWVQGGHAQSAAAALLSADAAEVTILVLARRVDTSYKADELKPIYDQMFDNRDYTLEICPVTGGACPTGITLF